MAPPCHWATKQTQPLSGLGSLISCGLRQSQDVWSSDLAIMHLKLIVYAPRAGLYFRCYTCCPDTQGWGEATKCQKTGLDTQRFRSCCIARPDPMDFPRFGFPATRGVSRDVEIGNT